MEFGFELTQDEPNAQNGHVLCRVPFDTKGSEIHAKLEYVVEAEKEDSIGEGFCIYLVDPSVPEWDRDFATHGATGFLGKKASLLGIEFDLTGNSCGSANHVAILAPDGTHLTKAPMTCSIVTPMCIDEDGDEVNAWRKVNVKLEVAEHECSVNIDGEEVIKDFKLAGIPTLPQIVCIGVCAGSNPEKYAHICVNDIELIDQDDTLPGGQY